MNSLQFDPTWQTYTMKGLNHCKRPSDSNSFLNEFKNLNYKQHALVTDLEPSKIYNIAYSDNTNKKFIFSDENIPATSVVPINFQQQNTKRSKSCDKGQWVNKCDNRVTVISPATSNHIFLPGCIGRPEYSQKHCKGGTFKKDDVIAMRFDYTTRFFSDARGKVEGNGQPVTDIFKVGILTENSLSSLYLKDGLDNLDKAKFHPYHIAAISEFPGDFLPNNPACRFLHSSDSFSINITDATSETALGRNSRYPAATICPLTRGKVYYINVRPLGKTVETCGQPVTLRDGTTDIHSCQFEISTIFGGRR